MAHTHLKIYGKTPLNSSRSKYEDLVPYEPSWGFIEALGVSFDPSKRRNDLLGPNTAQRFYIEKGFISSCYDDEPYIVPFIATGSKKAVLIIPGGAYQDVSLDGEGYPTAAYLQSHGITAFVLKYRVYPYLYPAAMLDCRRAICYIKAHAEEFGIDPTQLSMIGFSAGGNLAATTHYLFKDLPKIEGYEADEIDGMSTDLASLGLVYPELTGEKFLLAVQYGEKVLKDESYYQKIKEEQYLPKYVKSRKTPVFLTACVDDTTVDPSNSLEMGKACLEAGVPFDLHLFKEGGHGYGVAQEDLPPMFGIPARRMKGTREWINLYINFLHLLP